MDFWKKCSTCKNEIPFNGIYYVCSISTCRSKATNYAFCSVPCWDAHVPIERHRGDDVAAIEKRAPRTAEADPEAATKRRIIVDSNESSKIEEEILVVVSKVKKYITEKSGMNTSAGVMDVLTTRVQRICDRAIEEARKQGRKTVMDRDIV
jgi:hypothetical protein